MGADWDGEGIVGFAGWRGSGIGLRRLMSKQQNTDSNWLAMEYLKEECASKLTSGFVAWYCSQIRKVWLVDSLSQQWGVLKTFPHHRFSTILLLPTVLGIATRTHLSMEATRQNIHGNLCLSFWSTIRFSFIPLQRTPFYERTSRLREYIYI